MYLEAPVQGFPKAQTLSDRDSEQSRKGTMKKVLFARVKGALKLNCKASPFDRSSTLSHKDGVQTTFRDQLHAGRYLKVAPKMQLSCRTASVSYPDSGAMDHRAQDILSYWCSLSIMCSSKEY